MWIELVSASLWPATTLIVFFLIRDTIRDVVPRISTFKYKDFELEIAKHIGDAETSLFQLDAEKDVQGFSFTDLSEIQSDPQSAFATKWGELEMIITNLYKKHTGAVDDIGVLVALGELQTEKIIDDSVVRAFNELYQIKNIILFNKDLEKWQHVRHIFSAIVLIEKVKYQLKSAS